MARTGAQEQLRTRDHRPARVEQGDVGERDIERGRERERERRREGRKRRNKKEASKQVVDTNQDPKPPVESYPASRASLPPR